MTTAEIKNILSRSTKGDHEAIRALMDLGESYLKENDLANAAQAFKEAAISYRIDAFRQSANYATEAGTARWRLEIIDRVFVRWLSENEHLVPASKHHLRGIAESTLIEMFRSGALGDISTTMHFLEQTLSSMGVEFHSPGGSSLRVILRLLRAFGGQEDVWAQPFLKDVRIRAALDLLSGHIVRVATQKGL